MKLAVIVLYMLFSVTNSCTEIAQVCYKCRGDISVCTDGTGFTSTPEECVSHVMSSSTSVAAHYYPDIVACLGYTCDNNLYFSDSNRFAVRETCNTDCPTFTLTEHEDSEIQTPAFSSGSKSRGQCFADCFETLGCYAFSYDESVCKIYTSCGTSCTITSSSGTTVYTRDCGGDMGTSDCGSLTDPTNGVVDTSSGTFVNGQAIYTCSSGYTLAGSSTRTCQADGQWNGSQPVCNPITCVALTSPTNGVVSLSSGTDISSQAVYTCDTGYTVVGDSLRICQSNGHWNGSEPSCSIVNCGSLSAPGNGNVQNPATTTYLEEATFSCFNGYILVGSNTSTCQSNGIWSHSVPVCNPVTCVALTSPTNGVVSLSSGTTYLSQAVYTCDTGYTVVGDSLRICQSNGNWNGSEPSCSIVDCGTLSAPGNGNVQNPATTTYLEVVTFSCLSGYTLVGSSTSTCQSNSIWSHSVPVCNIVDCGTPTAPMNGTVVVANGTTYGQDAVFSCDANYTLFGVAVSTCNANGVWDASPSCSLSGDPVPEPVKLYILPCICYSNKTFTNLTQEEIINYLIKETSIVRNATSSARRKLTSAEDARLSSQLVGYSGIIVIGVGLGAVLLSDFIMFCQWYDKKKVIKHDETKAY